MLNSTNVGDGDYFPTFWQEDIHCRFFSCYHSRYVFTAVPHLARIYDERRGAKSKTERAGSHARSPALLRLCVGRSSRLQLSAEQKQIDA